MTEGKLAKWHVKVGDAVKAGQVICEIETDKATMEVEAVDEGTIAQILIEKAPRASKVNTPIASSPREGESVARCGQGHPGRCRRPRAEAGPAAAGSKRQDRPARPPLRLRRTSRCPHPSMPSRMERQDRAR